MEGWIVAAIAAVLGFFGFLVFRSKGGTTSKPPVLGGGSETPSPGPSGSGASTGKPPSSGSGTPTEKPPSSGSGTSTEKPPSSGSGTSTEEPSSSGSAEPPSGNPPPSGGGASSVSLDPPKPFGKPTAELVAIAPFAADASSFGLLSSAVAKGEVEEPTWVKVEWDGLELSVGAHALRAKVGDHVLRLPVNWKETLTICKTLGLCPPTSNISDAIWKAATVRAAPVPMGNFSTPEKAAATSKKMGKLEYALVHNENVDSEIPTDKFQELCASEGKDWILSKRNLTKPTAATTYGWHQESGKPIQGLGPDNSPPAHNNEHYDQTQVLRPIRRVARRVSDGKSVDLAAELVARGLPPACIKDL